MVQQALQAVIGQPVGGHAPQAALQLLSEELPQALGPGHRHGRLQEPPPLRVLQRPHQPAAGSQSALGARDSQPIEGQPQVPLRQSVGSGPGAVRPISSQQRESAEQWGRG